MQVNSAQDYLTMRKRRLIATTYNTTPPPGVRKNNAVFLSAIANNATRYERRVYPFQGAAGGLVGGVSWESLCCLSNGAAGAFGAFTTTTNQGIVRYNVIAPLGRRATTVTS